MGNFVRALARDGDGAFDGVCLREQRFDFGDSKSETPTVYAQSGFSICRCV